MRIGIDARLWDESGVGRYIRNLVFQLQKIDKKNEYVLFVLDRDYDGVKLIVNSSQFTVRKINIRWHTIDEQIKLPSIFNKENLDLVHFPYFSVPIFYNKPFVVTIHDLILHHFPTGQASTLPSFVYWLKLFGYKFIMQLTVKNAQKILTVSNATKEEIIDHLNVSQGKIVVTYEGVDDKITNSKSQITNKSQNTKYEIPNTKYFLYVGNAYPHKNLDRLVEAFAEIRNQKSEIKLILVGREDYFYKRLKEEVKKIGLEKQIVFYGFATDEELVNLYQNAQALIMPSLMEGFGLPVLEAMANKCLVLVSDIPAHREIAGDTAVYFDSKSIQDIAEKMKLISLNNLNHFSKNLEAGLERTKIFSWEKMAKETLFVYESCVSL